MARINRTLTVAEILQNVNSSTDIGNFEDWDRVLAAKVSHDHFDWIVDQIQEHGFTMPIVLHGDRWGTEGWTLGNGHHRMCAAILLGIDTIPVVITDSMWDWVEDSHDGSEELPAPSFEYWEMMVTDMAVKGLYGDTDGQAWRMQFGNGESASPQEEWCGNCGGCLSCCAGLCIETPCEYCGANNGAEYADHRIGCPEREYETLNCIDCFMRGYGYRYNHEAHEQRMCEEMAYAENVARGYLPRGAWHPERILASAYREQADQERYRALQDALAKWDAAADNLRAAVQRGAGRWELLDLGREAEAAHQEWQAL